MVLNFLFRSISWQRGKDYRQKCFCWIILIFLNTIKLFFLQIASSKKAVMILPSLSYYDLPSLSLRLSSAPKTHWRKVHLRCPVSLSFYKLLSSNQHELWLETIKFVIYIQNAPKQTRWDLEYFLFYLTSRQLVSFNNQICHKRWIHTNYGHHKRNCGISLAGWFAIFWIEDKHNLMVSNGRLHLLNFKIIPRTRLFLLINRYYWIKKIITSLLRIISIWYKLYHQFLWYYSQIFKCAWVRTLPLLGGLMYMNWEVDEPRVRQGLK